MAKKDHDHPKTVSADRLKQSEDKLRQSEERLRESEHMLGHLIDNLPHAVVYQIMAEPDGGRRFTFISRAVERLNEVTVESVLADAGVIYRQFLPAYTDLVRQHEEQALKSLTPLKVEVQSRLPSGRLRWFEYTSTPRYQTDGLLVWDGVEIDITERKLAEEKLAKAFLAFPELISIASMEDGKFIEVNESFLKRTGFSKEEVIGRTSTGISVWVNENDRERYIKELTRNGYLRDFPSQFRMRSGEIRDFLLSSEIIELEGDPCSFNFITDITERKRAERALAQSEERFRKVFEEAQMGIVMISPDFKFERANPAFCRMLGYSENEFRAMTFGDITHPEYRRRDVENVGRLLRGEIPIYQTEKRYLHKNGEEIWASVIVSGIRDEISGALQYFLVLVHNTTERKLAEKVLKQSEQKFAQVFRACPLSITIANMADGRYVDVNDVFLEIAGMRKEEVIGHTSNELKIWMDPEHRRQYVKTLTRQGFLKDYPLIWRSPDGKTHYFLTCTEIVEIEGKPCTLNFITDITERKRAEEEKLQLQSQLQQSQKLESVGRLAGGVAHDFNNMLNVILGYAELAQTKINPADALYSDLQEIITAALRSAKVTRQLLAFARKQTVAPKVLNLNEAITGMYKMLQPIIGEQIQIDWRPAQGLWPVRVDPSQIDQILANLCINARDAIAGDGAITITTGNRSFDAEDCATHPGALLGDYVWLSVRDNGCGMDKEVLAHVFEPFFTTKGVGQGTGLGLAMIYGSVRQNNGFIKAESEPGRGSCFTIYLPRFNGETSQDSIEPPPKAAASGKETILLVEDEPAVLSLTQKMLERDGYTVLAANTPADALQLAGRNDGAIHLLMTDVIMPGMNGNELAQSLLALRPQIKVLYISGYPANAIANLGVLDAGVHFLQKPFIKKDLSAKVREVLDQK